MVALQKEKYDHADTAFWMYETALRKTDKMMDELQPEDHSKANSYLGKMQDTIYQLDNIIIGDDMDKPVKSNRNRSKNKKKQAASQKTDIKMEPLYPEPKAEPPQDANMQGAEENITCPCNENKNDDWVGCDMHELCEHEWFHLTCVNLTQPPPDEELWFCDGCKKKYKKEIEQKLKDHKSNK